ncbi:hypothetical protein ABZZ04_22975 [Streptomyces sp. NPDC006435]|uniref:hypothetical protein n=1 Tax=Streptomyces sp. NPDC006435 TaxID=3154300 RepID=UPI0033A224D5
MQGAGPPVRQSVLGIARLHHLAPTRPDPHDLPGHRPGLGAFLGDLPSHPFKDTFGDGGFIPLSPHFRQLFGRLLLEFVQFRAPRGDPFQ